VQEPEFYEKFAMEVDVLSTKMYKKRHPGRKYDRKELSYNLMDLLVEKYSEKVPDKTKCGSCRNGYLSKTENVVETRDYVLVVLNRSVKSGGSVAGNSVTFPPEVQFSKITGSRDIYSFMGSVEYSGGHYTTSLYHGGVYSTIDDGL